MPLAGENRPFSPQQNNKRIKGTYLKGRPLSAQPWPMSAWAQWGRHSRKGDTPNSSHWVFNSQTQVPRPQWSDRHSVACNNKNTFHARRRYFDDLPRSNLSSAGFRIRPSDVEPARCLAAACFQAEGWEWKKERMEEEEEDRLVREAEQKAEAEAEAAVAAANAAEDDEETAATLERRGSSVQTWGKRSSISACNISSPRRMSGSGDSPGTPGTPGGTPRDVRRLSSRSMSRKATTRTFGSVEDRRRILEQQIASLYKATNEIPSLVPFADFYLWALQKFGNLTRCWRLLDSSLNMKLSYLEFLTSLRKYEFSGDARLIFRMLDRDRSGTLLYYHFDSAGAVELALLKEWARKKFGSITAAFKEMDYDRNGKISLEEFRMGCKENGFEGDDVHPHIFEMLDLDRDRQILPSEMEFLDEWECPPWLNAIPDPQGAEDFKNQLMEKYRGNAIIAWTFGLDRDNTMRVNWLEFAAAGKRERVMQETLPGIWRCFDTNLSGWISLQEFDPQAFKLLADFKKYCAQWGSIQKALPVLDRNENGNLSRKELIPVFRGMGLLEDDADILWEGLELNGDGIVSRQKIAHLDKWNCEEDEREEEFWGVVGSCMPRQRLA